MPSEASEQIALANDLNRAGFFWTAVPNGGKRALRTARSLKAQGVRAGIPDLLIFDPPPQLDAHGRALVGCAIELKRADGRPSDVSKSQWKCLEELRTRGWLVFVAFGRLDAIKQLKDWGYVV